MQNSNQQFRWIIKLWLLVSLIGVVWNLLPVFAQYRLDQQKLAEIEEQRRHPPTATVHIAEDSPWPGSTIVMQGQPVEGLDDANLPGGEIRFGQSAQMLITHRNVSLINTPKGAAKLIRSFPDRRDGESLFAAAISGDGKVIATVGEFTQVSFWDAATGKLLQTVEDDIPAANTEPDKSSRGNKHANGLRYSNTGARQLTAAPGGCLFAIGKVDGSVELWTAEGQPLPDRPHGMIGPDWPYRPDDPSPPPKRFHRLRRMLVHQGEVRQLEFTLDCQSLISVSGHRFLKMQPVDGPAEVASFSRPVYDPETTPTIIKTEVVTGTTQWQLDLDDTPQALALDVGSQWRVPGMLHPAQLAVALNNHNVTVMNLDDGSVLNTFSSRYGKSTIRTSSMAFGGNHDVLWTVGTRYAAAGEERHSYTSVSAWDVSRGKRVATAEVPGQIMASGWDRHGMQLATIRYFSNLPSGQDRIPWSFHLWNVKIGHTKTSPVPQAAEAK